MVGDAHAEVKNPNGTIDMVFLDADKEAYIDYLNRLLPLLRPGGVDYPPGGMSITYKKE